MESLRTQMEEQYEKSKTEQEKMLIKFQEKEFLPI